MGPSVLKKQTQTLILNRDSIQFHHQMCLVMGGTPLPFKGRQACQPHIQLFFGFAPPSCIHKTKHRKGEKIAFQWPKVVSGILLQALEVLILEVRKGK